MEGDEDGHGLRVTTWFTAGILQLFMQIPGRQEKARLSRNVPESHYAFMSAACHQIRIPCGGAA
jgi:hypothetical protein